MKKPTLPWFISIVALTYLLLVEIVPTAGIAGQQKKRVSQSTKVSQTESHGFLSDRLFEIRSLGNRCVDVGGQQWWAPRVAVIIFPCNRSLAQQIRVVEIDFTHDVTLRTADSSFCLGIAVPPDREIRLGYLMELQACDGSPAQRFALDGDSIMVGNQGHGQPVSREFVIETVNRSTQERTRLNTSERDVSDAQYFRLFAFDGSNAPPTTGFVSVSDEAQLDVALKREWGAVIEVTRSMMLTTGAKLIPEGVTVRGYRKFTDNGPEIYSPQNALTPCDRANLPCAFILQNNSRLTSLRLRGPKTSPELYAEAAFMRDEGGKFTNVTVDHIDASDWTGAAVHVAGALGGYSLDCCKSLTSDCEHDWYGQDPAPPRFRYPRLSPVKILGNIIHNNPEYGVLVDAGGNPLIKGNLLFWHTHNITADAHPGNGYVVLDNLITRWVIPGQPWKNNSFLDIHGSGYTDDVHWSGGIAGDLFNIGWNTFLSHEQVNFRQRGTPCHQTLYHENVSVQGANAVITQSVPPTTLVKYANKFNVPDPLTQLSVGDFDGDGLSDIFFGTGATWWYSSGGRSEWRFLNRMPDMANTLRFGDFDGDGRTDVLSAQAQKIMISWAGISPWTPTLITGRTIEDIAVGNFDGDDRDDIFVADGTNWFYWAGGITPKQIAPSNLRPTDIRFGDFNNDRKTDIFFVSGNDWRIIKGGGPGTSEFLRYALTPNVQGMVVADFDGDGYADVARDVSSKWKYSARGLGAFITLRNAPSGQKIADRYVGNFDGNKKADVIVWDSVWFGIAPGIGDPVARISWQGMR